MKFKTHISIAALVAVTGTLVLAQSQKDKQPQLPPGWTEADAQSCAQAGAPGPQHARLTENVGVWQGKCNMWMAPGAEPVQSECTTTITSVMDGRFTRCEVKGEIPGMGPFTGFGVFGYDNVAKQFQSTWLSNCSTSMSVGTGSLSSDGQTVTWQYTHSCPIAKKPTIMREVERRTGKDTMTLENYVIDPKTGKEFKMMEIAYTRTSGTGATAAAATGNR
jgi:hypothetical protein